MGDAVVPTFSDLSAVYGNAGAAAAAERLAALPRAPCRSHR
jgi:hypothetical protein